MCCRMKNPEAGIGGLPMEVTEHSQYASCILHMDGEVMFIHIQLLIYS